MTEREWSVHIVVPLLALLALAPAALAGASRQAVELTVGGGAWVPTGMDFDTSLETGPAFRAGVQIPMSLGNVIYLHTGYMSAGSGSAGSDGVSCVPAVLGYRLFPLYRRYAGPRALEPFLGVSGGGMIVWDSSEQGAGTTTGGGLGGVELGARLGLGSGSFVDFCFGFDYARAGGKVAGENDLSGFRILAMLSLSP